MYLYYCNFFTKRQATSCSTVAFENLTPARTQGGGLPGCSSVHKSKFKKHRFCRQDNIKRFM
jgi:hypothetical protein